MKIKGIILSLEQYKDNHKIVNCLNEDGLFSFLAKGVRKESSKNRSLLLDLNIIEAEFYQKNDKKFLINGKTFINQNYLYEDYYGLIFVNLVKELFFKLLIEDEYKIFYKYLYKILLRLNKNKSDELYLMSSLYLFIETLKINGYDVLSFLKNSDDTELYQDIRLIYEDNNYLDFNKKDLIELLKYLNKYIYNSTNIEIKTINLL